MQWEHSRDSRVDAPPFVVDVRPDANGGWLTEIKLGDGASLTRWFADPKDAYEYPHELASWLKGRQSAE